MTDVYPPGGGGSGWSTHALALVLRERGHNVEVIGLDPAHHDVRSRQFEGISVIEVGVRGARRSVRRRLGARDYAYARLAAFLSDRLRQHPDVDLLHAQHLHSGPAAIDVGRSHGKATIVTLRDYWPVCLHGTSWWGETVCPGCSVTNLTACMTEYWSWPRPAARLMVPWARRRLDARRRAVQSADQVIVVSDAVKRRVAGELPHARLAVVPNMVDPRRLEGSVAQTSEQTPATPFLLTAGKLQPTKGFEELFAALGVVGCPHPLVVAGDGPARPSLETQAQALGLPVTFLGWVPHDRLLTLQQRAHAVVLPSAWEEPLSRIVLETMGVGTPVVAWARGGNPEMIESSRSGWLVTGPPDLARAFSALSSDDERQRVGRAGRARVDACFSPDVVYPQVVSVYAAALELSKAPVPAGIPG